MRLSRRPWWLTYFPNLIHPNLKFYRDPHNLRHRVLLLNRLPYKSHKRSVTVPSLSLQQSRFISQLQAPMLLRMGKIFA